MSIESTETPTLKRLSTLQPFSKIDMGIQDLVANAGEPVQPVSYTTQALRIEMQKTRNFQESIEARVQQDLDSTATTGNQHRTSRKKMLEEQFDSLLHDEALDAINRLGRIYENDLDVPPFLLLTAQKRLDDLIQLAPRELISKSTK